MDYQPMQIPHKFEDRLETGLFVIVVIILLFIGGSVGVVAGYHYGQMACAQANHE